MRKPKVNAVAERFNGTIKNELLKVLEFFSIKEVKETLRNAITLYDNARPHMSLDNMTPTETTRRKDCKS